MKKHLLLAPSALLGIGMLFTTVFTSCVRERDTNTDQAQDEILGEMAYYEAVTMAEDAATKKTGELLSNYKTSGYCATLTHDEVSMPRSISIDFGATNCMCSDARYRRGKIIVSYTGTSYNDPGNVATINFENYFIDNNRIMGSVVMTNKGLNVDNQSHYNLEISGKMLREFLVDTIYWNAKRVRTWIQGEGTPVWGDDRYEIEGTGNGRSNQLGYYSSNIVQPLVKGYDCRYYPAGRIEMQPQGKTLRTIDFGDGNCDREAWVEIDNKRYSLTMY
ncbi:MAG: hypothetical protein JNM44_05260 [Chitinophagaceae bacterium]|nr:hypothetical protein [Chitinophagaceae bacterium]